MSPRLAQSPLCLGDVELKRWGGGENLVVTPEDCPPPTLRGDWVLTAAPPGCAHYQVCRMKINKIDVLAKNTKHVGLLLLLLVFVKLFFFFLTSFLEKCSFSFKEGRKLSFGSPRRLENLHLVPSRANLPRRPSDIFSGSEAPGLAQPPDTAFLCSPSSAF